MTLSAHGHLDTQEFNDIELDESPEVILAAAATLFGFEVDNEANEDDVYVKFRDHASSFSVGTDAPDFVFLVKGGTRRVQPMSSDGTGHAFASGIIVACVTTGGTEGSVGPTSKVRITLKTN